MKWLSLTISLLFVSVVSPLAQTVPVDSTRVDSTLVPQPAVRDSLPAADTTRRSDTVLFVPPGITAKTADITNPENLERHLTQNPTVALFKSMLVPGLGQIGNHRYVKAGIAIGLETWFIASAIHYGLQASDLKDQYNQATDPIVRDAYYREYQRKRNDRLKYTWFAGITVFVSMFDAYVDAQLSGAPDASHDKKLGFDIRPDSEGGASLALTFTF